MPNYCPDCGQPWTDGHDCNTGAYYTITSADVGKRYLDAWGKKWPMSDLMGYIQPIDVGKRIYRVGDDAGVRDILQVENNQQRDARLAREA